jgi:putative spermidine/putrescine transport system permease protein
MQVNAPRNDAWMIIPAVLFLLAFFVIPLGYMVKLSFDPAWSVHNYTRALYSSTYYRVALTTFSLSALVTLICLVFAYPLAFLLASVPARTRRLLFIPLMIPYLTSLMVRSYAWMVLLGREGLINQFLSLFGIGPIQLLNTTFGTYIGMVHSMLPLMVLSLFTKMVGIDMRLISAAKILGAAPAMVFFRVYLPLSFPGIATGCSLVLITSLGFFIIPALLGSTRDLTIAMLIERQVGVSLDWGFASALGVILLVLTLAVILVGKLLVRFAPRSMGLMSLEKAAK